MHPGNPVPLFVLLVFRQNLLFVNYGLGPFTNDVSKEGEGGGWPISDERRGGCVDLVLTRVREGFKNPENLADVICERPLIPDFS